MDLLSDVDHITCGHLSEKTSLLIRVIYISEFASEKIPEVHILLIRDMVVEHGYRQFGCETIRPTHKFTSMNLLRTPCLIA